MFDTVKKTAESAAAAVSKTAEVAASTVTKGASKVSNATVSAVSKAMSIHDDKTERKGNVPTLVESSDISGVMVALMEHRLTAVVTDLDHYRRHGLVTVGTDYVLQIQCLKDKEVEFAFLISKTFPDFRDLVKDLYTAAEQAMFDSTIKMDKCVTQLVKYCYAAFHSIESQSKDPFFGKVDFQKVQTLAKQRSQVINDFLEESLSQFPDLALVQSQPFALKVASLIEKFFLTDHCESVEEEEVDIFGSLIKNPIIKHYRMKSETIVPQSTKTRQPKGERDMLEKELVKADLYLDQKQSSNKASVSPSLGTIVGKFLDEKPLLAFGIFVAAMQVVRAFGSLSVTIHLDVILVAGVACFSFGLYSPQLLGFSQPKQGGGGTRPAKRQSVAMSSLSSVGETDREMETIPPPRVESPMPRFPEGAALGSVLHCWSDPPHTNFNVRGEKYLSDRKKIKSGPFLFPARGIDLFLTDQCPENVGRISCLVGGELRSLPTFIINFRLPWGVLLFYFEIPERFLPFVKCCYGDESVNKAELEVTMQGMSNADRCCARFLLGDDKHKNSTLKIFPSVVEGPWMVKASVGGKPAIIGTKLPVNYVYEPEGMAADGTKRALYLEADLDICSNSTARGILSMVRSCTQDLTIDLGFGIQGNSDDELPEQMLTGTRIHGVDPLNAPDLPPMKGALFGTDTADDDSDSEE